MATAAKMETATTSIATIVAQTPVLVLIDEQKREQLYEHIQREIDAFEPDLSTQKGRDAIKSLAFKITRTKTAIDAAGKELNEEARAKINAVDAARRDAREKLDAMAKAVRAPLTEWEEAEAKRIEFCTTVIADLNRGAVVTMDDTAETVRARGKAAWNIILTPEAFGDMLDEAQAVKDHVVATLKAALDRLVQEEADRAELARLRAEVEERARLDAEREAAARAEREAAEAKEREVAAAAAAEERRIAAEKAEAARIEAAAKEAEERAKAQAEKAARDAAAQRQREHDEDLAAERRRAEEAEAAIQAERDRAAKEAADAKAEREREAAAQAKREADQKHRNAVKTAAKHAFMTCGADEETAKKIVLAIIAGEVPAVSLRF